VAIYAVDLLAKVRTVEHFIIHAPPESPELIVCSRLDMMAQSHTEVLMTDRTIALAFDIGNLLIYDAYHTCDCSRADRESFLSVP